MCLRFEQNWIGNDVGKHDIFRIFLGPEYNGLPKDRCMRISHCGVDMVAQEIFRARTWPFVILSLINAGDRWGFTSSNTALKKDI